MHTRRILVFAAALTAACGVSKDKYAAKEMEATEYMKKYQDESQKAADLEKKNAELQAQVSQTASAKARLEQEKGELERKSAQYEQLAASLKGQIAAGQVEISELRGRMMVKLKDKILFASGSAAIGREGRGALDNVAEAFKDLQGKNVLVAGYTDNVPTSPKAFPSNWELSTARAIAVVKYLQSKGVAPVMLGAAGFSEYRPVAGNDSPEGRSLNRRIEIALTPADYQPPVVETPTTR